MRQTKPKPKKPKPQTTKQKKKIWDSMCGPPAKTKETTTKKNKETKDLGPLGGPQPKRIIQNKKTKPQKPKQKKTKS
jgi:hypothetical protein